MRKIGIAVVLVSLGLFALIPFSAAEGEEGIAWVDFNTGYARANSENRIAVIDCYTDWCGWCKVMDKKTFADSAVIQTMQKHFVAIKFNPEQKGKEYYIGGDTLSGPQLLMALSQNDPKGYPTIFYYIPAARRMIARPGYQGPEDFQKTLDDLIAYQRRILEN